MRDDIQHSENSEKLTIAAEFFTNLFGKDSSLPVIDPANLYGQLDISMLDEPISWAEIVNMLSITWAFLYVPKKLRMAC